MHTAQRAFFLAKGNTTLDQSWVEGVRFEFLLAPAPSEKSPIVFQPVRLYDECTFELCLGEDHESEQEAGTIVSPLNDRSFDLLWIF
jgi:hypothetical protein